MVVGQFSSNVWAKIERSFQNDSNNEISLDSLDVVSNIEYQQGDYGLDKFSIEIDYLEKIEAWNYSVLKDPI